MLPRKGAGVYTLYGHFGILTIDTSRCILQYMMEEIQEAIAQLQGQGWSIAAIGDELEIPRNTVERWKRGVMHPRHSKVVLLALQALIPRKRIPKGKRYTATRRGRSL